MLQKKLDTKDHDWIFFLNLQNISSVEKSLKVPKFHRQNRFLIKILMSIGKIQNIRQKSR